MAAKISTVADLFHRFHQCEMQLKQGKIAACLMSFREIIESTPAIAKTEKEKNEFEQDIDFFLRNLSAHKKFQDIFGNISFGDSDLETNLEFIKSMIVAQEEEIVERYRKDEETAEALRLEIDQEKQRQEEEFRRKIAEAIENIDQGNLPHAREIMEDDENILEAVIHHYNDLGIQCRATRSFEEAIDNYNKALNFAPDDEHLHYNMGRAQCEAGNREKAEDFLASALILNPEFKEGKVLHEYLIKSNRCGEPSGHAECQEKNIARYFKNIFANLRKTKPAAVDSTDTG
ncbi:MAG: tetratricopeptide repeat protein [Smithellaceae bacterium]|jgi:tetratricopeptide (TPR) repeat protein